ncbi:hypothetical protein E2C01_039679 [Portunus trituberculatus]|uniref:Uncharacterized protein n=1 Tax=Portunus trituberculatus TaxID=210409 RepID=A0A5B7FLC0_PORTR|nr:hypothetical protein [Portunus trituberculatus]
MHHFSCTPGSKVYGSESSVCWSSDLEEDRQLPRKFDMSHPCGLSDERIQQLLAEVTVDLTGVISFTEAYEPVTAVLWV